MNGHEKSDPIVVAMKPANKAGQPVAEPVERRVGTKGNAGQHNTRRAQNRESVTQALARVRQAYASPSNTRGKSRMRAIRTYGSVRGALSNGRPYRDNGKRPMPGSRHRRPVGRHDPTLCRSGTNKRCLFRAVHINLDDHAASRNRRSSRSRLARPYIWRLRVLSRLICPSTGPLLQASVRAARTAS